MRVGLCTVMGNWLPNCCVGAKKGEVGDDAKATQTLCHPFERAKGKGSEMLGKKSNC